MVTTRSQSKAKEARAESAAKIADALVVALLAGSAVAGATFGTGQQSFLVQADPAIKAAQGAISAALGAFGLGDPAHEVELYGRLVVILPIFFTIAGYLLAKGG